MRKALIPLLLAALLLGGCTMPELPPLPTVTPKPTENAVSAEINKIAKKPVKQVKPGYKKKRAAAIEKVKRKHRREMIESNIKALSKEKNRLKQRQKNIESGKYD